MHRRTHTFFAIVLTTLFLTAPVAGAQTEGPILDEAFSADLVEKGLRNGRLPSSALIEFQGCVLERHAGYSLSLMIEAAADDGVTLDPGDCYRTLEQQRAAYERNCPLVTTETPILDPATGEQLVDENGEPLTDTSTSRECRLPTASPSTSNHGWGRAIDFTVSNRVLGCGDTAFRWLQENAATFGFVHPPWARCGARLQEAWHWEWAGLASLVDLSILHRVIEIPDGVQ